MLDDLCLLSVLRQLEDDMDVVRLRVSNSAARVRLGQQAAQTQTCPNPAPTPTSSLAGAGGEQQGAEAGRHCAGGEVSEAVGRA